MNQLVWQIQQLEVDGDEERQEHLAPIEYAWDSVFIGHLVTVSTAVIALR